MAGCDLEAVRVIDHPMLADYTPGGYVAALVLRALAGSVDPDRAPRSLTVHYTAPPVEGPVRIETRVERVGRSMSAV